TSRARSRTSWPRRRTRRSSPPASRRRSTSGRSPADAMTTTAAPVAEATRGASSGGRSALGERPPGEPRLVGYLYLLPAFAVFFCCVLLPLAHAAWISLWDWDGLTAATWAGASNYTDVFSDEELRSAFVHALVLLVFYAVLPLLIGLVLAGVMARARVRGLA